MKVLLLLGYYKNNLDQSHYTDHFAKVAESFITDMTDWLADERY